VARGVSVYGHRGGADEHRRHAVSRQRVGHRFGDVERALHGVGHGLPSRCSAFARSPKVRASLMRPSGPSASSFARCAAPRLIAQRPPRGRGFVRRGFVRRGCGRIHRGLLRRRVGARRGAAQRGPRWDAGVSWASCARRRSPPIVSCTSPVACAMMPRDDGGPRGQGGHRLSARAGRRAPARPRPRRLRRGGRRDRPRPAAPARGPRPWPRCGPSCPTG
jgi:hypothetical protein